MAKIGYEVEGRLAEFNIPTYFCSVDEYITDFSIVDKLLFNNIKMIYISDHHNELDLHALADQFEGTGIIVTVELTELTEVAPDGVQIFWNVAQASYAQARTLKFLRPKDQIKIEHEKTVLSFVTDQSIVTHPEDFDGDIEV